jgi:nucleosome binding factor SPN SPT16 subunit
MARIYSVQVNPNSINSVTEKYASLGWKFVQALSTTSGSTGMAIENPFVDGMMIGKSFAKSEITLIFSHDDDNARTPGEIAKEAQDRERTEARFQERMMEEQLRAEERLRGQQVLFEKQRKAALKLAASKAKEDAKRAKRVAKYQAKYERFLRLAERVDYPPEEFAEREAFYLKMIRSEEES